MIVQREDHRHTQSVAGDKGGQRGPRNVVHVDQIRSYAPYLGGYNPIGARVKCLHERVVRQGRHIGHLVNRDLLDTVLDVDGFGQPVVDN